MKRMLTLLTLLLLALPALAEGPVLPEGVTPLANQTDESAAAYLVDRDDASFTVIFDRTEEGWRLSQLDYVADVLHVRDNGYRIVNRWLSDMWYGDVPFSTDLMAIDWAALPATVEEAIAGLDVSRWAYLSRDAEALRFFHMADGGIALDTYREGTPVRIVSFSDDGQDAFVKVCGGEVACWLPVEALVSADTQYENDRYAGWRNPWWLPSVEIAGDMTPPTICAAPEGEPLCTLPTGAAYRLYLLADCQEDGWLHVTERDLGVDGYVHVSQLPQDNAYVQAVQLLPDYLCQSGSVTEGSCGFIMTNPAGETVFVGGELLEDSSWRFTESRPLPEGASCDTYHSSGGELFVFSVLDEEATALYGEDTWTEYVLRLHDGQWLLDRITGRDWMGIGTSPIIYADVVGMLYGTVTFDRNAATLDWSALPDTLAELMALTARDWAILKEDAALCAAPAGDALYQYHIGTPVEILSREGEWAQAAVLGGAVQGWLPVLALAFGAEQIVTVEYVGWDGEPGSYDNSLLEYAPRVKMQEGTEVFDAPEGDVMFTLEYGESFALLSDLGNGWYHVHDGYMDDYFVRTEDVKEE